MNYQTKVFILVALIVITSFSLDYGLNKRQDQLKIADNVIETRKQVESINDELKKLDGIEYPVKLMEVTAYNSVPEQTDDSPCIDSDNTNICERFKNGENICASNDFPLGSRIIVESFGECTITGRTNKRFSNLVDLYFGNDVEAALNFGRQYLLIQQVK
jgi:3D (Asp-Asp-Asp) domain-containing protein